MSLTRVKREAIVRDTYGYCTKCGKTAMLGNGLCWKCWDEEANKLYNEDIPPPIIEKPLKSELQGKPGAWVDRSVPTQMELL